MADQTITLQPGDSVTIYAGTGQSPEPAPAATPDASAAQVDPAAAPADAPAPSGVTEAPQSPQDVTAG